MRPGSQNRPGEGSGRRRLTVVTDSIGVRASPDATFAKIPEKILPGDVDSTVSPFDP
jgi:hypothetical protein